MDGATKPAYDFLPFESDRSAAMLKKDVKKARELMAKAGFADGEGFPKVRLIINRNNVQMKIAKSVANMWRENLNIETDVVELELKELDAAKQKGDFDMIRRGVVLPTADEVANMLAIFDPVKGKNGGAKKPAMEKDAEDSDSDDEKISSGKENLKSDDGSASSPVKLPDKSKNEDSDDLFVDIGNDGLILTEEEAVIEIPAIPLYFPTSYSLVKPYVRGFEMNTLDAPSLKIVLIEDHSVAIAGIALSVFGSVSVRPS